MFQYLSSFSLYAVLPLLSERSHWYRMTQLTRLSITHVPLTLDALDRRLALRARSAGSPLLLSPRLASRSSVHAASQHATYLALILKMPDPESEILRPLDASNTNSDDWEIFILSDARIVFENNGKPASLLAAYADTPLRVEGRLESPARSQLKYCMRGFLAYTRDHKGSSSG